MPRHGSTPWAQPPADAHGQSMHTPLPVCWCPGRAWLNCTQRQELMALVVPSLVGQPWLGSWLLFPFSRDLQSSPPLTLQGSPVRQGSPAFTPVQIRHLGDNSSPSSQGEGLASFPVGGMTSGEGTEQMRRGCFHKMSPYKLNNHVLCKGAILVQIAPGEVSALFTQSHS